MSNYYTPRKGVVNRYWKRPKPRVYECNVRDAERFYQQSYKEYLEAKEWAARKASDERSRIGDDSRWTLRRTNSLTADNSDYNTSSRSSYLNSNYGGRQYDEDSYTSSLRSTSMSGSRKQSPPSDVSIEDRLQKLQKLRSELGLPSSEISSGTSKVTFSIPTPTGDLSKSRMLSSPDPRERRGRTVDVSNTSSYSSTRGGSRAFATDLSSDSYGDSGTERSSRFSSKYSYDDSSDLRPSQNGTERSSRFASKYNFEDSVDSRPKQNGTERSSRFASKVSFDDSLDTKPKQNGFGSSYSRDDTDKYSYKSSYKNEKKYDDGDDSYSYKSMKSDKDTGGSKSYTSSRKTPAVEDHDLDDYDADEFLSNIKKKIPTSEEILERIKKMDTDM